MRLRKSENLFDSLSGGYPDNQAALFAILKKKANQNRYTRGFMQGFITVIKPQGCNSMRAVARVKKITGLSAGHMGTLDPMASGVLPVAIGKATRLFPYFIEKQKVYDAEFIFGEERDTLDATGTVVKTTDVRPNREQILAALPHLTGEIQQVPPRYSACFVDGKRGYALARRGVEFELKPKTVRVDSIEYLGEENGTHRIKVACGGGTYIRSLIRDLGYLTGSLATMTALCRTQSGIFKIEDGVFLDDLSEESILSHLLPPEAPLSYPVVTLNEAFTRRIVNGLPVNLGKPDGFYTVFGEGGILGVGEITATRLKIKAYLKED